MHHRGLGAGNKEDQGNMLRLMLDAVYVDMTTGKVIGLKPKFAFLPLFKPGGAIGGKRGALSYWRPRRAAKSPPVEL